MVLPALLISAVFQLVRLVNGEELSVIRHADGDIFTTEGSCDIACTELSSGTGTPYLRDPATSKTGISIVNGTCICQCNGALPVFREDLNICVSDIHGVTTPVCGIAGSQQLGKSGWIELRNLSNAEPPFRLFRDEGRTFLQWIGEDGLKDAAEGKVVVAKLVCRDASPNSNNPGVFTPCVAFRVAGSPSKSNIREVTFASTGKNAYGLSAIEYIAIGISSILLALIYVASVSLYLHSRKARRKTNEEPEVVMNDGREGAGLIKNNPLLIASRHFESDSNSVPSDNDLGDDLQPSDGEQGFENQVTSAMIHPHCMYMEHSEGFFGGTIVGERIPDENVRIVETIENPYQHDNPVLPGIQRRKLYFNPAYFDKQLLLAPPPAAIEFLMKIREVISIAKHKMTAKRFVPTLTGIPEEDTTSECCSPTTNKQQRTGTSVQGSVARSRKSQRCTGCPGCVESPLKNLPQLPDIGRPMIGENRVRAWLEHVKPPERRWKDAEDSRRNFQDNARSFVCSFEHLKEIAKIDFMRAESANVTSKSSSMWKDNPPMLRTFQNIARSEILVDEDRQSVSKRSTKSMFEESNYDRYYQAKKSGPSSLDATMGGSEINEKVRKAIENSFIKQMEENASIEGQSLKTTRYDEEAARKGDIILSNADDSSDQRKVMRPLRKSELKVMMQKRPRKGKAPSAPVKELLDMINELPSAKIPAKRIMDAVIKEMVDVKALEHHPRTIGTDYEIDSLERTNRRGNRKISISEQPSTPEVPTSPTNDDKVIAISDAKEKFDAINDGENVNEDSRLGDKVQRRNYYNNLPAVLSQKSEGYSLVSEVYVNDGYVSPAGSDDSGPDIRYEPENPGHLTIKVQDSPDNYVKQDDSEYEPDTLDRKPMRLKINGDVIYDRENNSESYVDSLERPCHILLKSKGSFRDDNVVKTLNGTLQRGYGSLREIYEARLRTNLKNSSLMSSSRSLNGDLDNTTSWKKNKYLTPDTRQAKRQRKPQNQPDVVPLPPADDIYQKPKPPRRVEYNDKRINADDSSGSKNDLDRSKSEAGDPTASEDTSVDAKCQLSVGNVMSPDDESTTPFKAVINELSGRRNSKNQLDEASPLSARPEWLTNTVPPWKIEFEERSRRFLTTKRVDGASDSIVKVDDVHVTKKHEENDESVDNKRENFTNERIGLFESMKNNSVVSRQNRPTENLTNFGKIEDSGYLSSTDSNDSQKHLLRHDSNSVSETDETESMCDGASESGAESVGTDSVFFGNFRRLSEISNFSKSIDSGVDFGARNTFSKPLITRKENLIADARDRSSVQASESESESFVTVLSPNGSSRRNSLVT